MSTENLKMLSQGLLIVGVLSFVLSMGSCFSCITAKREVVYDSSEEVYRKPDGTLGYGAKSHTTGGEGYGFYIIGFFVVSIITSVAGSVMLDKATGGGLSALHRQKIASRKK